MDDDSLTMAPPTTAPSTREPSVIEIDDEDSNKSADETPEEELGKYSFLCHIFTYKCYYTTERLKKSWHSPAYGFFKSNVEIGTDGDRTYHFFRCAAKRCKNKAGGVRRYQDSKDRAATSNLKTHAIKCFGANAVNAAFNKPTAGSPDGSIFACFARLGQASVSFSHRAHTTDEMRFVIFFLRKVFF